MDFAHSDGIITAHGARPKDTSSPETAPDRVIVETGIRSNSFLQENLMNLRLLALAIVFAIPAVAQQLTVPMSFTAAAQGFSRVLAMWLPRTSKTASGPFESQIRANERSELPR